MQLEPGQTQPTPSRGLQFWSIFIQQLTQTCWWELILEAYLTPLSAPPCCHPLPQWMRGVGCWCSEQHLDIFPLFFANVLARGCFPDSPTILIFLPGGILVNVTPWVYPSTCCISIMPLIKSANYSHLICWFVLPVLSPCFCPQSVNYPEQGSCLWLFGNKSEHINSYDSGSIISPSPHLTTNGLYY